MVWEPTSDRRLWSFPSAAWTAWTSSAASSSISVVSVPFDVTGDGPTMSLGLMMCMLFEEMRFAEAGRREAESVTGGGEELIGDISTLRVIQVYGNTARQGGAKRGSLTYTILAEEDRGPSNSEADISGWFEKAKFRFPVDARNGASRAMFRLVQTRLKN